MRDMLSGRLDFRKKGLSPSYVPLQTGRSALPRKTESTGNLLPLAAAGHQQRRWTADWPDDFISMA
jgi:hypothetical protein